MIGSERVIHGPMQPGEVAVEAADQLPMITGCALVGVMFAFPKK